MQKCNFFKTNLVSKDIFILRKNAVLRPKLKKYYKLFYKFFSKLPFNKTLHQKSGKFMARLLIYFFLTHDLFFFLKKLVNFLKNTPRKYQLKIVRFFKLINQHYFRNAFIYFGVSGLYFSVSGKFGGVGGSKKLKKKLVWHKPKFANRNLKLQRSTQTVWSFSGTTTWSVYASFK